MIIKGLCFHYIPCVKKAKGCDTLSLPAGGTVGPWNPEGNILYITTGTWGRWQPNLLHPQMSQIGIKQYL